MPKAKAKQTKKTVPQSQPQAESRPAQVFSNKPTLLERLVPVLTVLSIGLAFMVGVLWQKVSNLENGGLAAGGGQQAVPKISMDQVKELFKGDFIKFGDGSKKLLLVEIADPSCPYCHAAAGTDPELNKVMGPQFTLTEDGGTYVAPVKEMKKLVDSGKADYMYIYYPGHGSGEMAMKSLYCAQEQGKFWPAHDLLMSNAGYKIQNGTDENNKPFTGIVVGNDKAKSGDMANFLGGVLDKNLLKSCLDSGKYDARLASDMAKGQELAQYFGQGFGTPAFFVNTTPFGGAYNWNDMKSAADEALQ